MCNEERHGGVTHSAFVEGWWTKETAVIFLGLGEVECAIQNNDIYSWINEYYSSPNMDYRISRER